MTSRLIRSGPPDLLFNSTPGQSGVFQPPGPLHQVTQVAAHGKRAGPSVEFYHSAGRQPANSTPRPAGGERNNKDCDRCNVFGQTLVDLCCVHNIHIMNGRFHDDVDGNFTCLTSNGCNVVDYLITYLFILH